ESLDVAAERLRLPLAGAQLVTQNANLIAKDLHLLLDLDEIGRGRPRTALFAPVDLVEAGDQGDEARDRENDQKPQSYVSAAHAVDSTIVVTLGSSYHTIRYLWAGRASQQGASARLKANGAM